MIVLTAIQIFAWACVIPYRVGGVIAEESEKQTLDALLLTELTPFEIVLQKLAGRIIPAMALAVAGWPVYVLAGWAAGLPPRVLVLITVASVSTVALIGALAIWCSARSKTAGNARALATLLVLAWVNAPPVLARIPLRVQPAELAAAVKAVASWVAPSSPMSLGLNSRWTSDRSGRALEERLLTMIGVQAVLGLCAVTLATMALGRAPDKRQSQTATWDLYRGFRPACGDNPIVWREYELPTRKGSKPKLWLWFLNLLFLMRHALVQIRAMFVTVFGMVLTILVMAIPIAIVATALRYGVPAFVELWHAGYSAGPFTARARFHEFLRVVTAVILYPVILISAAIAESKIFTERNKGTWPILLTTPLSGAEIIDSKIRASLLGLRTVARTLITLWILGALCGVIHPVGLVFAILDLILVLKTTVTFGIWSAMRSGSKTSSGLTAIVAFLALLAHGSFLMAAISSGDDLAVFWSWDVRWRWLVCGILVVIPGATACLLYHCTRELSLRFDEWVDRPRRSSTGLSGAPSVNGLAEAAKHRADSSAPPIEAEPAS
jgi:hypothetical protein